MSLTSCVSKSPGEALKNFDKAAQALGLLKGFEGTFVYKLTEHEYLHAKQELLIWMSYIP